MKPGTCGSRNIRPWRANVGPRESFDLHHQKPFAKKKKKNYIMGKENKSSVAALSRLDRAARRPL